MPRRGQSAILTAYVKARELGTLARSQEPETTMQNVAAPNTEEVRDAIGVAQLVHRDRGRGVYRKTSDIVFAQLEKPTIDFLNGTGTPTRPVKG